MITIYSVVYDLRIPRSFEEGTFTRRFTSKFEAERFAQGKTAWGRPAEVAAEKVPLSIVKRWGLA